MLTMFQWFLEMFTSTVAILHTCKNRSGILKSTLKKPEIFIRRPGTVGYDFPRRARGEPRNIKIFSIFGLENIESTKFSPFIYFVAVPLANLIEMVSRPFINEIQNVIRCSLCVTGFWAETVCASYTLI